MKDISFEKERNRRINHVRNLFSDDAGDRNTVENHTLLPLNNPVELFTDFAGIVTNGDEIQIKSALEKICCLIAYVGYDIPNSFWEHCVIDVIFSIANSSSDVISMSALFSMHLLAENAPITGLLCDSFLKYYENYFSFDIMTNAKMNFAILRELFLKSAYFVESVLPLLPCESVLHTLSDPSSFKDDKNEISLFLCTLLDLSVPITFHLHMFKLLNHNGLDEFNTEYYVSIIQKYPHLISDVSLGTLVRLLNDSIQENNYDMINVFLYTMAQFLHVTKSANEIIDLIDLSSITECFYADHDKLPEMSLFFMYSLAINSSKAASNFYEQGFHTKLYDLLDGRYKTERETIRLFGALLSQLTRSEISDIVTEKLLVHFTNALDSEDNDLVIVVLSALKSLLCIQSDDLGSYVLRFLSDRCVWDLVFSLTTKDDSKLSKRALEFYHLFCPSEDFPEIEDDDIFIH